MSRTISAVFDGEVFRPTEPVDVPADAEYQLTIDEQLTNGIDVAPPCAVRRILERATDFGLPDDFATQHDQCLHGEPEP